MKIKFLKADNGDSILISFQDNKGTNRNILIDGGMAKTFFSAGLYGELYYTLKEVKDKGEKIDLLILTHIDGDHIGGLKKWFENDKDAFKLINQVWFNSGKTIAKYFEEPENKELDFILEIFESSQTSIPQAIHFEDYIEKHAIWGKEIIKDGKTANQNGVKIQLLSPNDKLLKKLLKNYKKPEHDYFTTGRKNDWENSIEDFIKEENNPKYKIKEDTRVENGSSIALILSLKEKKYLLLGDAHSNIVLRSLNNLGYNKKNPIPVEFLKVSHHGSSKNTNKELLEAINTNNYIISTNSELHNHPNKRTLARIIANKPNATFYFNYDHVRANVFSDKDFEDFKHFKVKDCSEWK